MYTEHPVIPNIIQQVKKGLKFYIALIIIAEIGLYLLVRFSSK